ncbi:MAG: PepSY-like domain-containing protein [Chitinophagaceae bacterium]
MKSSITFLISLFAATILQAQKIAATKVPAVVRTSFTRQFPGIKPAWEKEKGNYEAGFKQNGLTRSALFDPNGTLEESEIQIPVAQLPSSVKAYMKIHYKGSPIKDAAKITTASGKIEYEAAINKKDILFDAKGNFLKEVTD